MQVQVLSRALHGATVQPWPRHAFRRCDDPDGRWRGGLAVRVAHFDCFSGISGDMVLGAVIDAGVPAEAIRAALDSLGLPITLEVERVKRCGFAATKATVEAAGPGRLPLPAGHRGDSSRRARSRRSSANWRRRSSASSRPPRPRSTACRSSASTSTRSARSTASPTSSARRSASICSASRSSPVRPCRPAPARVKAAHGIMPVPTPGHAGVAQGRAARAVEGRVRTHDADRRRDPHQRRHRIHRHARR